jgi:nitroreductase
MCCAPNSAFPDDEMVIAGMSMGWADNEPAREPHDPAKAAEVEHFASFIQD